MPQPLKYSSNAEKQRAYRERKRNAEKLNQLRADALRIASEQVVLSLFPGADLWGRAFEQFGFCVVRGPEKILGQDVRTFHVPPGRFDGVIGGPPCQPFSGAAVTGTKALDLIPEFVRLLDEANPTWAVMENVEQAKHSAPAVPFSRLVDWHCGGYTHRTRLFWWWGLPPCPNPARRPNKSELASYSVLATSWNAQREGVSKHSKLTPMEASQLQGFDSLGDKIVLGLPGGLCSNGKWRGVSKHSRDVMAVHMLGNGVPKAMGLWVASWVLACQVSKQHHTRELVAATLRDHALSQSSYSV